MILEAGYKCILRTSGGSGTRPRSKQTRGPSPATCLSPVHQFLKLRAPVHPSTSGWPRRSLLLSSSAAASMLRQKSLCLISNANLFTPSFLCYLDHSRTRVLARKCAMDLNSRPEQQAKEFDDPKSLNTDGISASIMPHILNMYGSRANAKDFEIYAPNATFEDPLMCAHGVKQIKSAFYSLPKVFSESGIVDYTLKAYETAPGKVEILIDNKQHYKIFGKDVDLVTLIKLKMEQGKIIRHEDWWDKNPPKSRETMNLQFVGRLAEITRRGAMLFTHALMGFGKDPRH